VKAYFPCIRPFSNLIQTERSFIKEQAIIFCDLNPKKNPNQRHIVDTRHVDLYQKK
jgi:hypothetical protein